MKSLKIIGVLMLYNLRLFPWSWYLWPVLVSIALLAMQFTFIRKEWSIGGFNMTDLDSVSLMFFVIIGVTFFKARAGGGGSIADGEFLLSRPLLRRTAYLSRMVLYFIVMLAIPLADVRIAAAKPDLRVDFYYWGDQSLVPGQVKFYQEQFPEASIIHQPYPAFRKATYDTTLMIPYGAVKIALWDLVGAMAIALFLQLTMLSTPSTKFRGMSFFGSLVIIYLFGSVFIAMTSPQFLNHITLYERAFFYFMHHVLWISLWTAGAFLLVQGIALKRIQRFDVI
jgi:hypothetical protein